MFRWLHWGMAFLIIALIGAVEIKGALPKGDLKHFLMTLHKQAGLLVFGLVWLRLIWRVSHHHALEIQPYVSSGMKLVANLAHVALYSLMIGMPLLGVLALQTQGKDADFFGWILPVLLDEERGLPYALKLKTAHEWAGNILIGLAGLHVAAALFHHWIRRDNTLIRMVGGGVATKK